MTKIKLTPEQYKVFESGNKINTGDKEYLNYPYWISPTNEKDVYDVLSRDQIPGINVNYKRGGLQAKKYEIKKTDGTDMDQNAFYFVLRLDKDPHAQNAAKKYAQSVTKENPILALELLNVIFGYNPLDKMSSNYWKDYYPYGITDPDGWDRSNFDESWNEQITWTEFCSRADKSTIIFL